MKVNPTEFILNREKKAFKKIHFISGNEFTLMEAIKNELFNEFKEIFQGGILHISNVQNYKEEQSLFNKNQLIFIEEMRNVKEDVLNNLFTKNDYFVFFASNTPTNKKIKKFFIDSKDCCLIECYEISKTDKIKIVKSIIDKNSLKVGEEVFWFLIDRLDNRYGYLYNELNKLQDLNEESIKNLDIVSQTIVKNNTDFDKIFFNIFKKNSFLVEYYKDQVKNDSDLSAFFYSFKNFTMMITNETNETRFKDNFPRYLFKEKDFFFQLFHKIDDAKRDKIVKLLYKTESLMRISFNKNKEIGMRFLLNFKKIIVS